MTIADPKVAATGSTTTPMSAKPMNTTHAAAPSNADWATALRGTPSWTANAPTAMNAAIPRRPYPVGPAGGQDRELDLEGGGNGKADRCSQGDARPEEERLGQARGPRDDRLVDEVAKARDKRVARKEAQKAAGEAETADVGRPSPTNSATSSVEVAAPTTSRKNGGSEERSSRSSTGWTASAIASVAAPSRTFPPKTRVAPAADTAGAMNDVSGR